MSQTYQGFQTNAKNLQGPARGQGPPNSSQLQPRHQSPELPGGPRRSEFASIQDQAFRGNWGPRAKPKAKPPSKKPRARPNQTLHPPGLHGSKKQKRRQEREFFFWRKLRASSQPQIQTLCSSGRDRCN